MERVRKWSRFTKLRGLFCLLSIHGTATAQEASKNVHAQEMDLLADISLVDLLNLRIDSASKRQEKLTEIPASVVILTRSDIERFGYATLDELLAELPGFFLVDNYEDQEIGVRGTLDGGIQFLMNSIPIQPSRIKGLSVAERLRMNVPIQSIDRIEVVRGPMSVIYGNNAFSGSVNIITHEVDDSKDEEFHVAAAYGNRNANQGFARVSYPWKNGGLVLNGGYQKTDGIQGEMSELMSPEQLEGLDPEMLTSLDGLLAREQASVDLEIYHGDFSTKFYFGNMDYGFYVFAPSFHDGNQLQDQNLQASLAYDGELSDEFSLKSYVVYSHQTYDLEFDFLSHDLEGQQSQVARRLEAEISAHWSPLREVEMLWGFNHQALFDLSNQFEIDLIDARADRKADPYFRNDLFGEVMYSPFQALQLRAGARLSALSKRTIETLDGPVELDSDLIALPRFSIIAYPDQRSSFKLLVGMATQDHRALPISEKERMKSAEISYLTLHDNWNIQASVYWTRVDNLLRIFQRLDEETGVYVNDSDASGARVTRGAELMGSVTPLDGLRLDASTNLQRSSDLVNPEIEPDHSPSWLVKGKASYSLSDYTFASTVRFVDSMHSSFQWESAEGEWSRRGDSVPAYALLSANIRYDHTSGVYFNLHGSNLLDQQFRYPANELVNFQKGGFGLGREILFTVAFKSR